MMRDTTGDAADGIRILRLEDGEAWVAASGGRADRIQEYVLRRDPYGEECKPETLQESNGIRVTKLDIPGLGPCVLKEMSTRAVEWGPARLRMAFRILFRRKYRRTFRVAKAARAAGVDVYEPLAYWFSSRDGLRMFFLCEFVEGISFESCCRDMARSPEFRVAVLDGFRQLGLMAARLNANGILNCDMIPRNCIVHDAPGGRPALRLIDLDLAFFAHGERCRRSAFLRRMKAFRRFVTIHPLDDGCLSAFLEAYSDGNKRLADACRKALGVFRRLPRLRTWAAILVWLCCPPPDGAFPWPRAERKET